MQDQDPLIPIARLKPDGHIPFGSRTIRKLIADGRLKAVDLNPGGKRPRWAVATSEVARFRAEIEELNARAKILCPDEES